jgi:hypothetical protein
MAPIGHLQDLTDLSQAFGAVFLEAIDVLKAQRAPETQSASG